MISCLFYIFQVSANSQTQQWYNTTFCVCEDRKDISCSVGCKNFRKIGYKYKDILKVTRKYTKSHITFLVYGTTNIKKPEFYLSEYFNISLNIVSATTQRESIILNGIDKNSEYYNLDNEKFFQIQNQDISNELYCHFSNINIYFFKEKYVFNHLMLHNTSLLPSSESALSRKTSIFQNFLTTDFTSLLTIPGQIKHISPNRRIQVICNESVNHVYFLEDHQISIEIDSNTNSMNHSNLNKTAAVIDLRNLKKNVRANIVLKSRNLTMTFQFMPQNEDEIPKIDFKLKKSAKILVDTRNRTFEGKLMKIDNINFIHGTSSIYFYSNDATQRIPTFSEEGIGTVYKNNEVSLFSNTYCICEGTDCQVKCGGDNSHIIPYDIQSLDKTVIGNPSNTLKYVISNSSPEKGKHPIFDLEHFGDKTLTVIGITKNEHIEFTGDATDDVGTFSFTNLCFHGNRFLFPEVFLHDVRVASGSGETGGSDDDFILNSTMLKSDISTLKNIYRSNVTICAPLNGYEIHTTNILNQVSLLVISPSRIKIDNSLPLRLLRTATMKIFGSGIVNIFLDSGINESGTALSRVNSFPRLRIYLEGDKNVVTFPGKEWPESLRDVSSKLTLIHGENDVYVNGDTTYDKNTGEPTYNTAPPIVDHEGSGAFFLNGKLSNYADKYCICEPIEANATAATDCDYLCQDYGPVTGFSADEIEKKAVGNPIRSIQYFIVQSSIENHPVFNLMKFADKSFSIVGVGEVKQYLSLVGSYNTKFTSSSVSHLFQNVHVNLSTAGFYFFNSVEFSNCTFCTRVNVSSPSREVIEFKKNAIRIYHFGMTIDITSLHSLYNISPHLIYPSKNYLHIDGGCQLKAISIDNNRYVSLFDNVDFESGIQIDVSMLFTPLQVCTGYGDSLERPFIVRLDEKSLHHVDDVPDVFIDVQNIPSGESFVMFSGRKSFEGEFHNLTKKITVSYGQTNIHLMTKVENAKKEIFNGVPPHVTLIGDGEYYINNEKQGSVFAPGNIVSNDNDDVDDSDGRGFWFWFLVGIVLMIIVFFVFVYFNSSRRRKMSFFDRWRDDGRRKLSESDISLNHFEIDLDDVTLSD